MWVNRPVGLLLFLKPKRLFITFSINTTHRNMTLCSLPFSLRVKFEDKNNYTMSVVRNTGRKLETLKERDFRQDDGEE